MHRFRFFIIGFICSILSYNLFASKVKLESVSVQLKWFYQYQFAGIIMAKEKGFYEDFGLDVTIKERNPKLNNIQQVLDGESQYGVADAVTEPKVNLLKFWQLYFNIMQWYYLVKKGVE